MLVISKQQMEYVETRPILKKLVNNRRTKIIKHQKNYLKVVCVKQANHFPLTALMAVLQHCKLDARTE